VLDNFNVNFVYEKEAVNLWIWDTAGQEAYDRLRPLCYPSTDVFLLVFSVTTPSSFTNVMERWYPEIHHYCPEVPVILCGTQMDNRMVGKEAITTQQGLLLATKLGVEYIECSALTNQGVQQVFNLVVKTALETNGGTETRKRRRMKKCLVL